MKVRRQSKAITERGNIQEECHGDFDWNCMLNVVKGLFASIAMGTKRMTSLLAALWILSCFLLHAVAGDTSLHQQHQPLNYTWQVLSQAREVIWSFSSIQQNIPRPILHPNLCQLALRTANGWGLEDIFSTGSPPNEPSTDWN